MSPAGGDEMVAEVPGPVGDGETGPLVASPQPLAVLAPAGGESGLAVVPSPRHEGFSVHVIFLNLGQRWYRHRAGSTPVLSLKVLTSSRKRKVNI